jgi:hypothetical protein
MKVIYNLKNMMNKEFQYFVELQLIEVMNKKIVSDSIRVNLESDSNVIDEND